MRDYPHLNFPLFDRAAAALRMRGFTVISPADLDRAHGFDCYDQVTPEDIPRFIQRDVAALCSCEAIGLLPNWVKSRGAVAEWALSRWLNLRSFRIDETESGFVVTETTPETESSFVVTGTTPA